MHVVKMIAVKNGAYVGIFQRRVGGQKTYLQEATKKNKERNSKVHYSNSCSKVSTSRLGSPVVASACIQCRDSTVGMPQRYSFYTG